MAGGEQDGGGGSRSNGTLLINGGGVGGGGGGGGWALKHGRQSKPKRRDRGRCSEVSNAASCTLEARSRRLGGRGEGLGLDEAVRQTVALPNPLTGSTVLLCEDFHKHSSLPKPLPSQRTP